MMKYRSRLRAQLSKNRPEFTQKNNTRAISYFWFGNKNLHKNTHLLLSTFNAGDDYM